LLVTLSCNEASPSGRGISFGFPPGIACRATMNGPGGAKMVGDRLAPITVRNNGWVESQRNAITGTDSRRAASIRSACDSGVRMKSNGSSSNSSISAK